jgi:hypothetical protein
VRLRYLRCSIEPKNSGKVLFGTDKQFMLRSMCSRYSKERKEELISPKRVSKEHGSLYTSRFGVRRWSLTTWAVRLLHLMPLHRQQSWPCHEARRLVLSLVMPFLKESKEALSAGMQLPPWASWSCNAPLAKMLMMQRRSKR